MIYRSLKDYATWFRYSQVGEKLEKDGVKVEASGWQCCRFSYPRYIYWFYVDNGYYFGREITGGISFRTRRGVRRRAERVLRRRLRRNNV